VVEYRTRNRQVAGSTHTLANCKQPWASCWTTVCSG